LHEHLLLIEENLKTIDEQLLLVITHAAELARVLELQRQL